MQRRVHLCAICKNSPLHGWRICHTVYQVCPLFTQKRIRKSSVYGVRSNCLKPQILLRFRVCCAVCSTQTSWRRISHSLWTPWQFPCPQTPPLQNKSIIRRITHWDQCSQFHAGHHLKLSQLCSFCACAVGHMTVRTRELSVVYIDSILKFNGFGDSSSGI